jgi:FtsP/CotA-like multicopper oxidase with cupredoxin domain
MQRHHSLAVLSVVFLTSAADVRRAAAPERIQTHDNEQAAGSLKAGVLRLQLDTRMGTWYPHGATGPSAEMVAFGEVGRPLQIPGPLIRVPAGTDVIVSITNSLADSTLTVHGLVSRPAPAGASDTVTVAPGATREVKFRLDVPGAYYYWGTVMGRPFRFRVGQDAQLSGAIIVDPQGAPPRSDRVLVFGEWADTVAGENNPSQRRLLLVINGRSWPHTSRVRYHVGDTVHFRLINTSADVHPMHLHGFYFRVDGRGNGVRDTTYGPGDRDMVVTERLTPGMTASISWVPERPGNWLFHCHFTTHFAVREPLGLRRSPRNTEAHVRHTGNHALEGMSGLVMGVEVAAGDADTHVGESASDVGRRRLRLLVRPAGGTESEPFYAFTLNEHGAELPVDTTVRAGQPIVLRRNEPVSITVVNRTSEPTAVHWHGIELDSYFDGVAGFSGDPRRLSPVIAPGDSFEARFTPPRSGTFIYHTHVDEPRQQPAGLSGMLVVVDEDEPYDASREIPVLITTPRSADIARRAVALNGRLEPPTVELRAGVPHRFRLINITVGRPGLRVEVLRDTSPVYWRAVAKDGADLPNAARRLVPARQGISIGETFDFQLTPSEPGAMRLEVRSGAGVLLARMPLVVR